jgi:ABC-2 type transport system permease protein
MVTTIQRYSRLYFLITSQYIKARMQYRADFIISSIGILFQNAASLLVFWVLFHSIPTLAGWSFSEIIFIYGFYLLAAAPAQVFFDHIWSLRMELVQGTFIKYYFRPMNMMFYFMSDVVDLKGFAQVVIGIGTLIYASVQLGLDWTPSRVVLLVILLSGAALVVASLLMIAAFSAFWVLYSFSILALAFRLREFSQYPTTIFDGIFRFIFTYVVPIGFVAFYPSQLFLRPEQMSWLVYLSPLVGILFFILAYRVWILGVNSYTGTGS